MKRDSGAEMHDKLLHKKMLFEVAEATKQVRIFMDRRKELIADVSYWFRQEDAASTLRKRLVDTRKKSFAKSKPHSDVERRHAELTTWLLTEEKIASVRARNADLLIGSATRCVERWSKHKEAALLLGAYAKRKKKG